MLESANKGQAARMQAVNEKLSFCQSFLLPSLLNCALFFTLSSLTLFPSSLVCSNLLHFSISSCPFSLCFIVSFFSSSLASTSYPPTRYPSLSLLFLLTLSSGLCSRPCGGWGLAVSFPESGFLRRESRSELMAVFAEGSVLISRPTFPTMPFFFTLRMTEESRTSLFNGSCCIVNVRRPEVSLLFPE